MSVDDAHTIIQNALRGTDATTPGLHDLRLADLNEYELEEALRALDVLHRLDEAFAERSTLDTVGRPSNERVGGDV